MQALNELLNLPWPKYSNGVSWKDLHLAGKAPFKDISKEAKLQELIYELFPNLSFSQIAKMYQYLNSKESVEINWEELLKQYNLRWCEILELTINAFLKMPDDFKDWCHLKKISARDLAPLLTLSDYTNPSFNYISSFNLSKSEGAKTIDWLCDLVNLDIKNIYPETKDSQQWLKKLYKLKYPNTTKEDSRIDDLIKTWPWPKSLKPAWKRSGDSNHISINLNISSQTEFLKRVQELEYINNWVTKNNPNWDKSQINQNTKAATALDNT